MVVPALVHRTEFVKTIDGSNDFEVVKLMMFDRTAGV